jgi:hypothetical protein
VQQLFHNLRWIFFVLFLCFFVACVCKCRFLCLSLSVLSLFFVTVPENGVFLGLRAGGNATGFFFVWFLCFFVAYICKCWFWFVFLFGLFCWFTTLPENGVFPCLRAGGNAARFFGSVFVFLALVFVSVGFGCFCCLFCVFVGVCCVCFVHCLFLYLFFGLRRGETPPVFFSECFSVVLSLKCTSIGFGAFCVVFVLFLVLFLFGFAVCGFRLEFDRNWLVLAMYFVFFRLLLSVFCCFGRFF